MASRCCSLTLVAALTACGDKDRDLSADAAADGASGRGAAQIGVGRPHDPAWITQVGGPADDDAWALSVDNGAIFLGGSTTGSWFASFIDACLTSDPDAGVEMVDCGDAFVIDLSTRAGIQFGGPYTDTVRGLHAESRGVFVTGSSRTAASQNHRKDGWAEQRSLNLVTRVWRYDLASANKPDELLAMDVDGTVFVAGGSSAALEPPTAPAGDEDMLVLGFDPATPGAPSALQQFGTMKFEEAMGIAVDSASVFVGGQTGGYLGAGAGTNQGFTDGVIVALDRSLMQVECRAQYGTPAKDVGQAIALSSTAVYVAGSTAGVLNEAVANGAQCNQGTTNPVDAFVASYDRQCRHQWTRQFGSVDGDSIDAVATDGSFVYVAGTTGGSVDHSVQPTTTDAFLRTYDSGGTLVGEVLFDASTVGTEVPDFARAIAVDASFVYVAGTTGGALGGTNSHLGKMDAFVAKIPLAEARTGVVTVGSGCP